jgi:hypothetical protein
MNSSRLNHCLFQKEPTSVGYVIAVINITLSSSGMITLFRQLVKQKHVEESTLKLEFEGINSYDNWYCLTVKKNEKAWGEVNNAQGFVTVEDTDIRNISTVWNNNSRPKSAISVIADLRLFKIQDKKNIIFHSASHQEEGETIALSRSYYDFEDKELIVKIGSSNAPIFTYKDKISKMN